MFWFLNLNLMISQSNLLLITVINLQETLLSLRNNQNLMFNVATIKEQLSALAIIYFIKLDLIHLNS